MASKSETGHANNVASLEKMILFIKTFIPTYNPSRDAMKIPQLEILYDRALTALEDVIRKNSEYNDSVNKRKKAFAQLKPFATRLISGLKITNASKEALEDAQGFNRKLNGRRASATSKTTLELTEPAAIRYSTSQQSYIQQVQHFAALVAVLENEPSYAPNEIEFQIATLHDMRRDLAAKNTEVHTNYTLVHYARMQRNNLFYKVENNLYDIATQVKEYIKMKFGTKSAEYAAMRTFKFNAFRA